MNRSSGVVVGDGLFARARGNPLLSPERWPYRINAVMNAGATMVGTDTVLLCRVEDRRGFSHLTVARSNDGVSNWVVDDHPLMTPRPDHPEEEWGLEDPRITRVDELDAWVIAYTVFGAAGPAVALATTTDFRSVKHLGVVCVPEDKNASLLPRRINGEFVLFHRPAAVTGGRADVWMSRSADRGRTAADRDRQRLVGRLPRGSQDGRRRALPGRTRAAGSGQPRPRTQAL
jgi:predicted GH43/DUF377 family glycosyl hydrolase